MNPPLTYADGLKAGLQVAENERQTLAAEIHDGFSQDVVAAQLMAQSLTDNTTILSDSNCIAKVAKIVSLLASANAEARLMIRDLLATDATKFDLASQLTLLLREHPRFQAKPIRVDATGLKTSLSSPVAKSLYRIIQEALHNAMKYSEADLIQVTVSSTTDEVCAVVSDNGQGFDACDIPDSRFGLRGMRNRAEIFGGNIEIRSEIGKGTTVTAKIPLE